ncbi:hypothetical protein PC9H_000605 [Pleurotus ostreatus]|uniref:AAA+ ATPase domain-containing protein n=1 Tax=Pleurotus ostreatus TaxID=5322 RepID=A0A8H7A5D9_PLEOS|nr:uncharacterized protein PC9H_000605 [Pleurotus ostreatus]KAF7440261.1 hypothetical protein PC9H_000605 [Pleurotus ostreatus]
MSGLLLALKDVIGDVEDDDEVDDDQIPGATEYLSQPQPDTSNASITLVHIPPAKIKSTSPDQSPISAEQSIGHTSFRATPDLLSPVGSEVSNLPSVPFPLRIPSRAFRRDDSIDSGYADSWHSPRPLVRSPPRSPALSSTFDILVSPFGTPSARVRGGTPAPVSPLTLSFDESASAPPSPNSDDVDSNVGSPPRIMDDDEEDGDFMHDDSLTSRPIAIQLGGPDSLSPPPTLVDVDGDFISQEIDEHGSPELDPLSAAERSWDLSENNATAIFSPITSPINEGALNIRQSLNVQNPTEWLTAGSTSFNQDDIALNSSPLLIPVHDAIPEHRETSPLTPDFIPPHSAVSSESSSASECVTADFLDDEDQTGTSSIFSPTARLAYMSSPEPAINLASGSMDDTLYSLYDVYTADSPKASPTPSLPSPFSDSEGSIFNSYTDMEPVAPVGSPASTISRKSRSTDKTPTKATFGPQRGRVFTPPIPPSPITRGRSGTVVLSPSIAQTETPPVPSPPSPTESLGEPIFASPPSPFHPFVRQSIASVIAPDYVASRRASLRSTGSQHQSPQESIRGTASPLMERDSFFSSPVQVEERFHEPFTSRRSSRGSIEHLDAAEDATVSWAADQHPAEASTDVFAQGQANASTSRKNSVSSGYSEGSHPSSLRRESLSRTNAAESSTAGRNRRSFLKPLRLSTISNLSSSISRSSYIASASSVTPSSPSMHTLSSAPPIYRASNRSSVVSASASASVSSFPRNSLISTKRISYIPSSTVNTISAQQHDDYNDTTSPMERNDIRRSSTYDLNYRRQSILSSHSRTNGKTWSTQSKDLASHIRSSSIFSEPTGLYDLDEDPTITEDGFLEYQDSQDEQICRPLQTPNTAPPTRPPSTMDSPHAIGTPSPNLIFAIASDDVDQVRQALTHGDTNPNERLGPQSALAFTVTNDALENKLSIVKTLLAHGADPRGLEQEVQKTGSRRGSRDETYESSASTTASADTSGLEQLDPATRYYIKRAGAAHTRQTSALIYRSFFRPLTKVRYEMVGQDRALEQLFKVLSIHSKQLSVAPIVVLLCGPSGHGKSLLARRFGSLLDVPTHTVNMTTVRSTLDLWRSYSLSPYEEPSDSTLAEFLVENEGKRCVVVLDEIEKTEDPKTLHSLLMPWELGRCSFEAGSRHVDVRNVIWLGTSNVGQELVFDHHAARAEPETLMSREEYVQLMALLRPRVSEQLGV